MQIGVRVVIVDAERLSDTAVRGLMALAPDPVRAASQISGISSTPPSVMSVLNLPGFIRLS
jgi:hypothetical protein